MDQSNRLGEVVSRIYNSFVSISSTKVLLHRDTLSTELSGKSRGERIDSLAKR